MRRNARSNQHADDYSISTLPYSNMLLNDPSATVDEFLPMDILTGRAPSNHINNTHRFENTMEAKVQAGDTLQAIALRFQCTVADIKRLNKIDKDNEIHARKIVKIPVTIYNVLLDNLPTVHTSGNSSPKEKATGNDRRDSISDLSSIVRNPLEDAEAMLSEKLMVASVNSSRLQQSSTSEATPTRESNVNNVILNSKLTRNIYQSKNLSTSHLEDASVPLINDILDDSTNMPQLHRIRGPSLRALDWSGSDCDMSWICLFVIILALCFVIPLVYVFYIAEHAHHNTTGSSHSTHH